MRTSALATAASIILIGSLAAMAGDGLTDVGPTPPGDCPYYPPGKTAQTTCWNINGVPRNCAGTGQDGEHQTGVSVTSRFTDNYNGTVTDRLTGLIWLRNANCFDSREWITALADANSLADGSCGLTDGSVPGDWRLPNVNELLSLADVSRYQPALPPDHPFVGVVSNGYWSSNSYVSYPSHGWGVGMRQGGSASGVKYQAWWVWPVRGGQAIEFWSPDEGVLSTVGPTPPVICPPYPPQQTGQTDCWDEFGNFIDCAGTGQDGEHQAGVSVAPRFTDNHDGTVTDNLTGLTWLRRASCLGTRGWHDALEDADTLADGACELSDGSVAGDWCLPNVRELTSLIEIGDHGPALPPGHPFYLVSTGNHWTSTTYENDVDRAWTVWLLTGLHGSRSKSWLMYAWPVRCGR